MDVLLLLLEDRVLRRRRVEVQSPASHLRGEVREEGLGLGDDVVEAQHLGRKRVIQVLFNMSVPRARVPEKASMLRDRSER